MQTPPSIYDPFWQLGFGNILTIVSLWLVLWGFHRSNVKRIKEAEDKAISTASQAAAEVAEIRTKLELIYNWFVEHVIHK